MAAVRAGALEVGQKGVIEVTILAGQDNYPSLTRNGIASGTWGGWHGSFKVGAAR